MPQARSIPSVYRRKKHPPIMRHGRVHVNLAAILSVDHACRGCARPGTCCCARYEVCVDAAELKRIIPALPEAARLCPHLKTAGGYDNIFDEIEPGLFALDTDEQGLCLLAYMSAGKIRCSLHTAALKLGLSPEKVKPQACLLWPLSASEDNKFLSLGDDTLSFRCVSRRRSPTRTLSPALLETIRLVYGVDFSAKLEREAAKGRRHAILRA